MIFFPCRLTCCPPGLLALLLTVFALTPVSAQPDRSVQFPEGWTSTTHVDGEVSAGWETVLLPAELEQRYRLLEVSRTTEARARGLASCRWVLTPKPAGEPWAQLRALVPPVQSCEAISLWLKNPQGVGALLGLKLRDADGAEFTFPPVGIGEERNWYEVAFYLEQAQALTVGGGRPRFPLAGVSLLLGDLPVGEESVFYIDELRTHHGPPRKLDVIELASPRKLVAGEPCPLRVRLRAQTAVTGTLRVRLGLALGKVEVSATPVEIVLPAEGIAAGDLLPALETSLDTPRLLTPGTYTVTVSAPGFEILVPGPERLPTVEVQISREDGGTTSAGIEGAPGPCRMVVRGEPVAAVVDVADPAAPQPLWPAAQGYAVAMRFKVALGRSDKGASGVVWPASGGLDFSALDSHLSSLTRAAPGAVLLPDIRIHCPQWWKLRHPRELMVLRGGAEWEAQPSFGSQAWRETCATAVAEIVRHIENGPFADSVMGYQLSGGLEGRWLSWDMGSGGMGDYSEVQRTAFQQWLRLRYEDLPDLRGAWGQPVNPAHEDSVPAYRGWGEVALPATQSRRHGTSWLLDPVGLLPVVDYRLFASWEVLDHVAAVAQAVRQETDGRKLCGVPYGHLMELASRHEGLELGGHLALAQLLRVPEIDFIVGPPGSEHPGATLMPLASIGAAGKAYVAPPLEPGRDPLESAALCLEQGFSTTLASPRDAEAVGPWASRLSAGGAADIAVIVDDVSCAYFGHGNRVKAPLITGQMEQIRRMGAAVDVWTLDDLLERRVPPVKMYVFLNLFRAGAPVIGQVQSILKRRPALTLWIGAPGIIGDSYSARLMRELTGIRCALSMGPRPLSVRLTAAVEPFTAGVRCPLSYGLQQAVYPQVQIIDPEVRVLGTDPSGAPALVAKRSEQSTAVLSLAPAVPAEVLRALARAAGVHVYNNQDDRLYVSRGLIALHADTAGGRTLSLPEPCDAFDVPGGARSASAVTQLPVQMNAGETRIWHIRPPAASPEVAEPPPLPAPGEPLPLR